MRSEMIRAEMSRMLVNQRPGLFAEPMSSSDPIFSNLYYRNMLRARTGVAKRSLMRMGREDYVLRDGEWAGAMEQPLYPVASPATQTLPSATAVTPMPMVPAAPAPAPLSLEDRPVTTTAFNDSLDQRLRERGERYLLQGKAYFREKDYVTASQYFEMYQQTAPHDATGRVLQVLCSYQKRDFNTAIVHLTLAFKEIAERKVTTLDEIKLDWREFFKDRQSFQAVLDDVTIMAKAPNSSPLIGLLMAYYQWLNDDLGTAISAMDTAITGLEAEAKIVDEKLGQVSPIDRTAYAKFFRDMLVASKAAAAAPAAGTAPAP